MGDTACIAVQPVMPVQGMRHLGTMPLLSSRGSIDITATPRKRKSEDSLRIRIPTYGGPPSVIPHLGMDYVRNVPVVSKYTHVWQKARVKIKTRLLLRYMFEDRVLFGTNVMPDGEADEKTVVSQVMRANSALYQPQQELQSAKWVFSPDNKAMWLWSVVYALLILQTTLVLPYRLAFYESDQGSEWYFVDILVDTFFFTDVIKTFNTAYYDSSGLIETRRLKIARKYIASWFFIDLISCIPMYMFHGEFVSSGDAQQGPNTSEFLRLLRVPRIYRLVKVSRFVKLVHELRNQDCLERVRNNIIMKSRTLKMVVFLTVTLLLIHLVACFWYLNARVQGFRADSWVANARLNNADTVDMYVASLYWVILTLATVGYGDILPVNNQEKILACVWMIFGFLFVTFAVGSIASLLGILHSKESIKLSNLAVIDEFSREARLPSVLIKRLREAVIYTSEKQEINSRLKRSVFNELPRDLRCEVALAMHRGAAKSLSFFVDKDKAFIVAIVPYLKHMFSPMLTYIYKENEYADEVYFIVKGSCYILATPQNAIRRMQRGAYFGEIETMKQLPRKFSVMTQLDTELLVMNKHLLQRIRRNFGGIYREMEEVAIVRDRLNEKARSQLFKLLRMIKDRAHMSETSQSFVSLPSNPLISLRRGSVLMKVALMSSRFEPAEKFDKLRYRMNTIVSTVEFMNARLNIALRRFGLEENTISQDSESEESVTSSAASP